MFATAETLCIASERGWRGTDAGESRNPRTAPVASTPCCEGWEAPRDVQQHPHDEPFVLDIIPEGDGPPQRRRRSVRLALLPRRPLPGPKPQAEAVALPYVALDVRQDMVGELDG